MIERVLRGNGEQLAPASGAARKIGWHGRWRRAISCVVITTMLSGCYSYSPLVANQPTAGMRVDLRLTDEGRIAVRDRIGPEVARVEGHFVHLTESSYVLRVTDVHDLHGARSSWAGEEVAINREYVALARERRLDRVRSTLVGGAVVVALVVIFATDLVGFGGDNESGRQPPIEGEQ